MSKRLLIKLLQNEKNLKKQSTLRKQFDITDVPVLVRNKSCECEECGGRNIKQIEEHTGIKIETPRFMKKIVAQHEKEKSAELCKIEQTVQRNIFLYITPRKIIQSNSSCIEQTPINPTLEQPKRDIQKLNRLIEKYETIKIEPLQQICKTLPDIVTKPPLPKRMRKQQTHYSFIRILPIGNEDQQSVSSNNNNSQQRTPYRNPVYKELNQSTILKQLQTPMFQKSKFCKNSIIDFADGVKKAMSKIKEMDEISIASKMISTHMNDVNSQGRQSLLLKSFLDCTKMLDDNPKSLKQLDVFIRPKSKSNRSRSKYIKVSSPAKIYLPTLHIK